MHFFPPRRIEKRAIHVLPEPLDVVRILADQPPRALFEHVPAAALSHPDNPAVGLDRNHHVALIEQWIWIGRRVHSDPSDLHFRNGRMDSPRPSYTRAGSNRHRFQQGSSIHLTILLQVTIPICIVISHVPKQYNVNDHIWLS